MKNSVLVKYCEPNECEVLEGVARRVAQNAMQNGDFFAVDDKRQALVLTELQNFIIDGLDEVFSLSVVNGISRLKILFNTDIQPYYAPADHWPIEVAVSLCLGADHFYFSIVPSHFGSQFNLRRKLVRCEIEGAINSAKIPVIRAGNYVFVHKEAFCAWAIQRNFVNDCSKDFFIRSISSNR